MTDATKTLRMYDSDASPICVVSPTKRAGCGDDGRKKKRYAMDHQRKARAEMNGQRRVRASKRALDADRRAASPRAPRKLTDERTAALCPADPVHPGATYTVPNVENKAMVAQGLVAGVTSRDSSVKDWCERFSHAMLTPKLEECSKCDEQFWDLGCVSNICKFCRKIKNATGTYPWRRHDDLDAMTSEELMKYAREMCTVDKEVDWVTQLEGARLIATGALTLGEQMLVARVTPVMVW